MLRKIIHYFFLTLKYVFFKEKKSYFFSEIDFQNLLQEAQNKSGDPLGKYTDFDKRVIGLQSEPHHFSEKLFFKPKLSVACLLMASFANFSISVSPPESIPISTKSNKNTFACSGSIQVGHSRRR